MRGPYGFEQTENCQTCELKKGNFFCQLTPKALQDFEEVKLSSAYPGGAVLFLEKQDPRGVFVLCAGQVKLSISSAEGKTLILRIARPGEVLGLMATMCGSPYEVTAETIHPCQVAFVRRADFLRFVSMHPEAYRGVVQQLATLYDGACEQLRTVGLSSSATEKLARLLINWSASGEKTKTGTKITVPLTHEEIAEFVGTTRETVTRTLGEFKTKNFVSLQGSTLMISNPSALETLGGF